MSMKALFDDEWGLGPDEPADCCRRPADEDGGRDARPKAHASADEPRPHSLRQVPAAHHPAGGRESPPRAVTVSRSPRAKAPGLFLDRKPRVTKFLRRPPVKTGTEQFHDSDVDIYDLFNACNGVVQSDGLLDIGQLDEYTDEEAAALNVKRLREVWAHTATGCAYCARVVRILRGVRGTLREGESKPVEEQIETSDINNGRII